MTELLGYLSLSGLQSRLNFVDDMIQKEIDLEIGKNQDKVGR